MPTTSGTGYFVGPGGGGAENLSLEDYLEICKLLNAQPYLEVPVTFTTADAANLIEFLASPSSTTFGAQRASLGQTEPWTSVFSKIHLSFCNECWNGASFSGQGLGDRSSAPNYEYYYDYSVRAKDIFAAMHADSYYTSAPFDLVMNAQTGINYSMDTAIARAHPDSIEIEAYTYSSVSDFSTDAALWQPAMVEPWEKVTNSSDIYNFYQSVHDY
jgi:alpha-L-arabinofuranosidase